MTRCALSAILLMVLGWTGCRDNISETVTAESSEPEKPLAFRNMAADLGIQFQPNGEGQNRYFFPAIMTGGAALFDFNGDDRLDLLLLNGNLAESNGPSREYRGGPFALFLQNSRGTFDNATDQSGFQTTFYANGCSVGDVNNDGQPDIYITGFRGNALYLNQGEGKFTEISHSAGLQNQRWSTSAAFLDFDRDGWLDLYVTNYVEYDPTHDCIDGTGKKDFCNPAAFRRTTDRLYRNITGQSLTHETAFADVTAESGIAAAKGAGLGVITADFNDDTWIDIYVANDGHGNFLWINQRDGTFVEQAALLGVAYDAVGQGQGSMGLAVADLNSDEFPDLVVTNLEGESNAVYLSQQGIWQDDSFRNEVASHSLRKTGFGTAFADLNNDGLQDLIVVNGRVRRGRTSETPGPVQNLSNKGADTILHPELHRQYSEASDIFMKTPTGFGRLDDDWDLAIPTGVARSLCCGDINLDGRIDLLVTYLDRPPELLFNNLPDQKNWLSLRVVEPLYGDRDAIGAKVTMTTREQRQIRWVCGGGSYQAAAPYSVHFGLGETAGCDSIEVSWPNGDVETFPASPQNVCLILKHGAGTSLTTGPR